MPNGQSQSVESPQIALSMKGKDKWKLLEGSNYENIGELSIVDKKSTKSGIRQVYKFTNQAGEENFFIASGSFKSDKDRKRIEQTMNAEAATYAIGDEDYRGMIDKMQSFRGEESGSVNVQPARENISDNPRYKKTLTGKYWSSAEQMKSYPVPTHGKPPKKSIGDFLKSALIGEEVRDVYGQPQHSLSLKNVLKEIPRALDVTDYFGFSSANLPGQETRSGFDWKNPGIVEDARKRQALLNMQQQMAAKAHREGVNWGGKGTYDPEQMKTVKMFRDMYKESLVEPGLTPTVAKAVDPSMDMAGVRRDYGNYAERKNALAGLLFMLASAKGFGVFDPMKKTGSIPEGGYGPPR